MHSNRRQKTVVLACAGAVVAVAAIGLGVEQLLAPASPRPLSQAPHKTSSPPAPARPSPSPTASALTGPLQVVEGREQVNGVELGFPHSTAGAVSAADADATEIFSTLDPDRAAAVARMVADPSWAGAAQQAAQGPANDRRHLGLPAAGPVPAGASLETQPAEYQVRDVTPDGALVLLLCDFTSTTPDQGTATNVAVFPLSMHWTAGDWKVASVTGTQAEMNLGAQPDSPRAAQRGWHDLDPSGA